MKPAWYWSSQRSLERTQRDTNACGTFSAIRTIVWWRWGRRGTIGVTCSRSWWDTALVTLLNPLRTRRFAEEELERTKTDSVDALGIARFAAQKHPAPTPVAEDLTAELRELV